MEAITKYLNNRKEFLIKTEGKANRSALEIERNLKESEGMTLEQFTQYLNERKAFLTSTGGTSNKVVIEIDRTLKQVEVA